MDNYVGKYLGTEIWAISFEDFVALDGLKQNTSEKIYLITNDNRVITKGKVFGKVTPDRKRLDTTTPITWQVVYAHELTMLTKKKKAAEEKVTVVTERPTTEALVKDTEKKLQEVKHVAENKVADLHQEAETKLAEVVEESGDAVQMVLETATEAVTDMAAESKKVLNVVAVEGAAKAEAVVAKTATTTTTRRKKKAAMPQA